eukprot:GHVT01043319.1.p1 GENE.GHVT01043319.1~~GHVT01043319.1.p1  ORF type:complete len:126 (+),score=5.92 GHVT01043319.1:1089-1466(+)
MLQYYGERLTGKVLFFDTTGCKDDDYHMPVANHENGDLPLIAMVRRGDCHFVNKAQVAEKKGAKALLVADTEGSMSTTKDVKKIIMADGQHSQLCAFSPPVPFIYYHGIQLLRDHPFLTMILCIS